jgi:bacterioferritin
MEKQELIAMLNKDMAEEHAAILRYLVHSYLEGEDTPLGASLLSRAREEMWHMHWLGMIVGRHGGEPNLTPAPYPYDPTNRATIFKSYVDYELKLVPHYHGEADKVDDPHIKRVLAKKTNCLRNLLNDSRGWWPVSTPECCSTFAPPGCSSRNPSLAGSSWISP